MKILCTVKRSIDPDLKVKLTADGELDMSNVDYILNYFDELGVEDGIVFVVRIRLARLHKDGECGVAVRAPRRVHEQHALLARLEEVDDGLGVLLLGLVARRLEALVRAVRELLVARRQVLASGRLLHKAVLRRRRATLNPEHDPVRRPSRPRCMNRT